MRVASGTLLYARRRRAWGGAAGMDRCDGWMAGVYGDDAEAGDEEEVEATDATEGDEDGGKAGLNDDSESVAAGVAVELGSDSGGWAVCAEVVDRGETIDDAPSEAEGGGAGLGGGSAEDRMGSDWWPDMEVALNPC